MKTEAVIMLFSGLIVICITIWSASVRISYHLEGIREAIHNVECR